MNQAEDDWVRPLLRAALTDAMKRRDADAVGVYRSTISAMDNAEAVTMCEDDRAGAVEASPRGVGVADRPRRALTSREAVEIVRDEAAEMRAAAALIRGVDPDRAGALDLDAGLLKAIIERDPGASTDG